ncbi:MAG: hypothetical protein ACE5KV_04010, partial [Thermoplasmata archaeon]
RNAEYGIFVIKRKEALPKQVGYFNEYRGTQLVTVYGTEAEGYEGELLEIAYKWARNKLLLERGVVTGVDLSSIGKRLDKIGTSLKDFSNILRQCTNVENASGKIRELCENMRGEISSSLSEVREEIRRAEDYQ